MGLTVATDEIFNAFLDEVKTKALLHGHSYTGNPLACAAACASLDLFATEEVQNNILRVAKRHSEFAEKIKDDPRFKEVRQTGTIIAIEVKVPEESSYFSSIRDDLYRHFWMQGFTCVL